MLRHGHLLAVVFAAGMAAAATLLMAPHSASADGPAGSGVSDAVSGATLASEAGLAGSTGSTLTGFVEELAAPAPSQPGPDAAPAEPAPLAVQPPPPVNEAIQPAEAGLPLLAVDPPASLPALAPAPGPIAETPAPEEAVLEPLLGRAVAPLGPDLEAAGATLDSVVGNEPLEPLIDRALDAASPLLEPVTPGLIDKIDGHPASSVLEVVLADLQFTEQPASVREGNVVPEDRAPAPVTLDGVTFTPGQEMGAVGNRDRPPEDVWAGGQVVARPGPAVQAAPVVGGERLDRGRASDGNKVPPSPRRSQSLLAAMAAAAGHLQAGSGSELPAAWLALLVLGAVMLATWQLSFAAATPPERPAYLPAEPPR